MQNILSKNINIQHIFYLKPHIPPFYTKHNVNVPNHIAFTFFSTTYQTNQISMKLNLSLSKKNAIHNQHKAHQPQIIAIAPLPKPLTMQITCPSMQTD